VSTLQAVDTNFALALIDPRADKREKAFETIEPNVEVVLPCIVYAEMWYGLALGRPERTAAKRRLFEDNIMPLRILWLDQITLQRFHDLSWSLARQGKPIGSNDIWIATLCLQHDAKLITNDSDFKNVPDLQVRNW
jgi:tRNA(fMet)-specific endonuclease VapC